MTFILWAYSYEQTWRMIKTCYKLQERAIGRKHIVAASGLFLGSNISDSSLNLHQTSNKFHLLKVEVCLKLAMASL